MESESGPCTDIFTGSSYLGLCVLNIMIFICRTQCFSLARLTLDYIHSTNDNVVLVTRLDIQGTRRRAVWGQPIAHYRVAGVATVQSKEVLMGYAFTLIVCTWRYKSPDGSFPLQSPNNNKSHRPITSYRTLEQQFAALRMRGSVFATAQNEYPRTSIPERSETILKFWSIVSDSPSPTLSSRSCFYVSPMLMCV